MSPPPPPEPPQRATAKATALGALLLAVAVAAFAAPPAAAHGGAFETSLWLGEEPLLVEVEGAPLPVADAPLSLRVTLPARDAPVDVMAQWISPEGSASRPETLAQTGVATYEVPTRFPEPGAWRLRVLVDDAEAGLDVTVHPAGRAFVAPADALAARGVLVAGAEETLAVRVTDAQGEPLAAASDARAHAELWDEAGTRLLSEEALELREAAPGEYVAEGRWDEPGLLRVHVEGAGWGLAKGDRPPVEVLVVPPEEAHVYGRGPVEDAREAPAPGWAWGLAALAGAALATRRGRRA